MLGKFIIGGIITAAIIGTTGQIVFPPTGAPHLCYGTPQVVEITNFTEPAEVLGVKASTVRYTYKLVDVAPWANATIIEARFEWLPGLMASQSIENNDDLILTDNGWGHHLEFKQ